MIVESDINDSYKDTKPEKNNVMFEGDNKRSNPGFQSYGEYLTTDDS